MVKSSVKNVSLIRIILISTFLFSLSSISCSDEQGSGQQFSMPPMPAEVVSVKMRKMTDTFEAVGTIEAIEEITIVSEIDAVIKSLPFKEGSFVKKGDLIAQLDEVRGLFGRVRVEDAVVAEDADRVAVDRRETADQRRSVARLELFEARAVHDPTDHVADFHGSAQLWIDDAEQLLGIEHRGVCAQRRIGAGLAPVQVRHDLTA